MWLRAPITLGILLFVACSRVHASSTPVRATGGVGELGWYQPDSLAKRQPGDRNESPFPILVGFQFGVGRLEAKRTQGSFVEKVSERVVTLGAVMEASARRSLSPTVDGDIGATLIADLDYLSGSRRTTFGAFGSSEQDDGIVGRLVVGGGPSGALRFALGSDAYLRPFLMLGPMALARVDGANGIRESTISGSFEWGTLIRFGVEFESRGTPFALSIGHQRLSYKPDWMAKPHDGLTFISIHPAGRTLP